MPKLENRPLSWFKPDAKQVRKTFDESDLRHLGESLRAKQLQPVLAQPDGTIIAGERRWRAAMLVELATLEVKIADEPLSESQVRLWQLVENLQRADLSGYEKWLGCAELMCMNPAWKLQDLAEHLHLDPSMVTRLLSPSKCIEAAQDALRDGKLGISDCYAISKLPQGEQAALLALKLSGASRDSIEQAGRKSRNGGTPAVKLSRCRVPLPTGTTVVVSGPEMSLADLIDALSSALDAARKASKDGLDVKTMQAVMKDKAKAAV
jgi:ParB/RepB/Spo0J family partition protein